MTQMTKEISQDRNLTTEIARLFPKQGEWTEADYFHLPETNRIVELSEGRLIISPPPTTKHQRVSIRLALLLGNYVFSHNLGEIVTAPTDTRLYKGVVRQPDIAFISKTHKRRITSKYFGAPDLVVEVLSKGTVKVDKEEKFKEYEKAGVLEYWIIDPFKQSIEIYTLENKAYEMLGKWDAGEIAKSKLLDGFEVSVGDIMV
jgi:Uma2 family endonuclease